MHNGGTRSFDFHPSPRMVPHSCKPRAQFVELSIEQFVPRGKKVGDGALSQRSPFSIKMSKEEKGLIARYFHSSKEDTWRPSLIAFPLFQAFASRVHKVRHSSKTTGMLIDAMQHLQGSSFSKANQNLSFEVNMSLYQVTEVLTVAHDANCRKAFESPVTDHHTTNKAPEAVLQVEDSYTHRSFKAISVGGNERHMPKPDIPTQKISVLHRFLFGEEFVTVNAHGDVSISSVPILPSTKGALHSNCVMALETFRSLNNSLAAPQGLVEASGLRCDNEQSLASPFQSFDSKAQTPHGADNILPKIANSGKSLRCLEDYVSEVPAESRKARSTSQATRTADVSNDMGLSPRLTHFIEEGIVPESPMLKSNHHPCSAGTGIIHEYKRMRVIGKLSDSSMVIETPVENDSPAPASDSPCTPKLPALLSSRGVSRQNKDESEMVENSICETGAGKGKSSEHLKEGTPVVNNTNNDCKENWKISSGEVSRSVHRTPKYRRLRKHHDVVKELPCKTLEEKFCASVKKFCQRISRTNMKQVKHITGKGKDKTNAKDFIEEEAEVSSDTEVSEDEVDEKDDDAFDDSFIDDGVNSAEESIQAKNSGSDMMAFYRRSLLTQSPMALESPLVPTTSTNGFLSPDVTETGSCSSERINNSLQTPGSRLRCRNHSTDQNPVTYQMGSVKLDLLTTNGETSRSKEVESKLESRKRKLSFVSLVSATNSQQEHQTKSECIIIKSANCQSNHNDTDSVLSLDDDFYEGLDLDAVEAQAMKLLRSKSEIPVKFRASLASSTEIEENPDKNLPAFPSFDLGIHFS